MNVVETALMSEKIKSRLLPTMQPVNVMYNSSSFGWHIDPFTGGNAFHEGLDFPAPTGTPIYAAADGVVIAAEFHPQYGNMLDIDHGNDIMTRYAHASLPLPRWAISSSAASTSPISASPGAPPARICISRCASGALPRIHANSWPSAPDRPDCRPWRRNSVFQHIPPALPPPSALLRLMSAGIALYQGRARDKIGCLRLT